MTNLLIVESPAKCKSLGKYLGKDFTVLASYGHIRDLLPKSGAVDVENNFKLSYELIEKNKKHLDAIKSAAKKSDTIYLATDPDREGEIISWHIKQVLDEAGITKKKKIQRVVFNEITKNAVLNAVQSPREISLHLVNAQQARRVLDYLVGFNLSPLLWKKIQYGLSAGRVQSPSLRMVVDRENKINVFISKPYWKVFALSGEMTFSLYSVKGKKLGQFTFKNVDEVKNIITDIKKLKDNLTVTDIEKKERKRQSKPPFITSTLQQEASRKLGFNTKRTMQIAQKLYEGFSINKEVTGLITYMRTDSVSLSKEGIASIRKYIGKNYGDEYLNPSVRVFANKSKNAQEAHEAIRPVDVALTPEKVKKYLDPSQYKLYTLIWNRTVASQMIHASIALITIKAETGTHYLFKASSSTVTHKGFLLLYDDGEEEDKEQISLSKVEKGEKLPINVIDFSEHKTEPPPRYSEATLVKAMEEHGIGRPSTYASTISTLVNRKYVEIINRQLIPTDAGEVLNEFLVSHFEKYVDYDFTAELENTLDEISRGEKEWIPVLKEFWVSFHELIQHKEKTVSREEAIKERVLGIDKKSGKKVSVRYGRYGYHVQIGTRDDEEKPIFGPLLPNMKAADVTLPLALKLCTLPLVLGLDEDDEKIVAGVGPFGPFLRYQKKKFVSIQDKNPLEITLEEAKEIIAQKIEVDRNKLVAEFPEENIQILNGRFGVYIKSGKRNVKIPKTVGNPETLTLKECQAIIEKTPVSKFRRRAS